MRFAKRKAVLFTAASGALIQSAFASNQTWNSLTLDAAWSTAANWSAGPLATGDALFFGAALTSGLNNDLAGQTYRSLNFNTDAPSYTIGGSPIHLGYLATGIGNVAAGDIVSAATTDQTINAPISLDTGKHLITTGTNALNLHGAITRGGASNIVFASAGGSINVAGSGLANDASGIIGGWATIGADLAALDGNNNVVAYTGYTNVNPSVAGATIVNGPTSNVRLVGTGGAIPILPAAGGGITRINTLVFGTGTQTFAAAQTANTGVDRTVVLGQNGALIDSTGNFAGATVRTLTIGANVATGGTLTAGDAINPATITFSSNPIASGTGGQTLAQQQGAGIFTLNSAVTDNATVNPASPAPVSVVIAGGYVTFNNANTYTGGTYILAGRISQPTSGSFGTGPIYIFPGAHINPGNTGQPVSINNNMFLSGNGAPEGGSTGALRLFQAANGGTTNNTFVTGTVTLIDNTTISSNGNTTAFANASRNVGIVGKITGPGGLGLGAPGATNGNGSGVVTIGSMGGNVVVNDYAGDTTINGAAAGALGGGLRIGSPGDTNILPHGLTGSFANGPTGNLVLNGSTSSVVSFDLNGSTQTVNGLVSSATNPGNNSIFSSTPGGMLIVGDSNATSAYAGNITNGNGDTGLTKIGSGIQTLSGNLNYTGTTTVSNGTLLLSSSANLNNSSAITVQTGANLDVSANGITVQGNQQLGGGGNVWGALSMSDSNATLAPGGVGTAGTLTVNGAVSLGGGTLRVDAGSGSEALQVNGNLTVSGTTTLRIDRPAGGLANGTYPLIRYTGTPTGDHTNFSITQNTRPSVSVTFSGGQVNLVLSGTPSASLTWSGSPSNDTWDLISTANFAGGGQFFHWDSVTFNDAGDNSQNINIGVNLEPTTITLANSATHPYQFTGSALQNVINVNKTGAGVATFNNSTNRFNSVTVSNGTLDFQNGDNAISGGNVSAGGNLMVTGQGTFSNFTVQNGGRLWVADGLSDQTDDLQGSIIDNGTVTFNHQGDFDAHASFSGSGTIRKQGTGQMRIAARSPNFTGTVELASGNIRLNSNNWDLLGSTSGGTVVISSGAQLQLGGISSANLGGISENAGGGFGNKLFKITGDGGGNGAILNDGGSQANAFQRVTLTGNSTVGANSRIDIRSGNVAGANQGTLDLAGNTLTKIGGNILGLANVNVTDGNILVNDGTLQVEGSTNIATVNPANSITVAAGKGINFLQTTGTITRPIVLAGDGTLQSVNNALANATATVGSNISLGGNLILTAPGASTLVLNGNISENPAASGRTLTKNTAAMFAVLGGSNSYTGGTTVSAGTLTNNTSFFGNGPLSIATASTARIAQKSANGATNGVSVVPALTITGTGQLDLTNNGLVIDYVPGSSPLTTIQGYVKSGYANGALTGTGGINSATAATNNLASASKRAIGYAEASALGIVGTGNFLGRTIDDSSILVRYTLSGDANLDGKVNAVDFNAVASNFGASGTGIWTSGDFDNNGNVDTTDFTLLAQNFNQSLPTAPPAPVLGSLVPEPGMVSLMAMGACALVGRRRRR